MSEKQKPRPRLTKHAVDKFYRVTGYRGSRKHAKTKILRLFKRAKKKDLPPGFKIERIINNDYTTAEYYEFGQYRFVIVDGEMVTFEEKF